MTRLEWTDPAVADLDNIHDYIARDSAEYAHAVVERLIQSEVTLLYAEYGCSEA